MKKYFFIVALFLATSIVTNAQTPSVKMPVSVGGFDVKGIASSVMTKLAPLALSGTQKNSVLSTVTSFLTQKSGIVGLATSAPAEYAKKFAPMNTDLLGKMKDILTAAQYTKFLGLKPKTNDPTNALSQLFF